MFKIVMICAVIGLAAAVHHPVEHKPLPHHVEHHPQPHHVDPHHPAPAHHGGGVRSDDVHAGVVSRKDDVRVDGFETSLELSNHIQRSESGDEHGNIHGYYGWISPEGEHIDIKYTADEHGYHPSGTGVHPIPDYIQRSIEWNAAHAHGDEVHHSHHGAHH